MDVVIDTDPGIDDALALLLAFNSSELNIKAIVATYGNVRIQQAVRNVLNILEVVTPSYIPSVIQGAGHPIRRPLLKKDYRIHGRDGLGNLNLPLPSLKPADKELSDIFKKSKDIFLICLGPLTTLAKLILANPGVINSLKEIILMGGAVTVPGNVTRFAEFNIYSDPDAAKVVLHCGVPITLVGLDVTHQTLLTENELKLLDTSVSRFNFIDKICRHYIGFHKRYRRMKGCFLHDPLAIAVAIDRNIVKTKRLSIDVQTEDKNRLGQTFVKKGGRPNADVCVEFDNDRFMKLLRQRIFMRGSRV